uniref:Uncharacterized protein n=1 Tax=Triticum urartu TaxID=4572 RepID=A0A8R7TP46_TRIUA
MKSQVQFATFLSFSDILSLTFASQRVIITPLRIVSPSVPRLIVDRTDLGAPLRPGVRTMMLPSSYESLLAGVDR